MISFKRDSCRLCSRVKAFTHRPFQFQSAPLTDPPHPKTLPPHSPILVLVFTTTLTHIYASMLSLFWMDVFLISMVMVTTGQHCIRTRLLVLFYVNWTDAGQLLSYCTALIFIALSILHVWAEPNLLLYEVLDYSLHLQATQMVWFL